MVQSHIMQAEQLGYRVTGDVTTQAGLNVNLAQQGLLTLCNGRWRTFAVAESGEIVYLFPKNFRAILRNKSGGCGCRNGGKKFHSFVLSNPTYPAGF